MQEQLTQFIDDMRGKGNAPANDGDITITNGEWRRFDLADGKPKNSNGYYRFTVDGDFAMGSHGSRIDGETHNWHSKSNRTWTDEEKAAWKARIEDERRKRDAEKQREHQAAAVKAKAIWKAAKPALDHDYLTAKGVDAWTLRVSAEGELLVPAYHAGKLVNLQRILNDGSKKFIWQARINGAYMPIATADDKKSVVAVVEGYATGASVRAATDWPVAVAFTAGNLTAVAQEMRVKYPQATIIIAADNDHATVVKGEKHNTGIIHGQQAAYKVKGFCIWPEFKDEHIAKKPTDFNDAHRLYGLEYVRQRVNEVLSAPVEEEDGKGVYADTQPHDVQPLAVTPKNHDGWEDRLMLTKRGDLDKDFSLHNTILFLTHNPTFRETFVFDDFSQKVKIVKPLPWDNPAAFKVRPVTNNDITRLRAEFEMRGIKIGKADIHDAVQVAAENCRINPVREYMDGLKWDRKPRLDKWLLYYCGAEFQPDEYVARVGACFMMAAVKRIYEPGAPFHHMLVLEGGQGSGKSTALKTLATFGDDEFEESYFTDKIGFDSIDNKAVAEFMQGNLIVEFQELSGLTKKDHNKVKSWITQTHDELQKKYQNEVTCYPRQWVLAGTTNDSHWLTDPTGNRRFWPVKVGDSIDISALKKDRQQLWAEAVHRLKLGELWFVNDDDPIYKLAKAEQATRYMGDVWEDVIMHAVYQEHVHVDTILTDILKVPKERWNNGMRARITNILRSNGYEPSIIRTGLDNKSKRVWVKK